MRTPRLTTWILLVPLLVCCSIQEPAPLADGLSSEPDKNLISGEAFIRVSDEGADTFNLAEHPETLDALGVYSMERLFPDAGEFEARHRAAGLHRWYRIRYDRSVARTKADGALSALPGVETVTFPLRKERRGFFNDPKLAYQWHYKNNGSEGVSFKEGMDINVEPVWEKYTGGSRDVIVAVIDGGVQVDHPDLQGVVLSAAEGSRNFIEGYSPEELLADEHGTHVAGTIAAINNNGIGVAGVAGGLDGRGGVRVMTCNIFSDKVEEFGDDAAAIVWAADHGAVIANNSWGLIAEDEEGAEESTRYFMTHDIPVKSAIDYFIMYAGTDLQGRQTGPMKGGLVLFASGNSGFRHDAISEACPVVSVGAFGPDGKMPLFSNWGSWVDILAPGGSDSDDYKEWIMSTIINDYAFMAGTSMACPHVAGVAALLVSYFGGPGFTVDQLKEALLEGATPDVIDLQGRTVGGGKLDAWSSFAYLTDSDDPGKDDISFSTTYDGDWQLKSHETLEILFEIAGNGKARLPVTVSTDCPGVTAECSARRALLRIDALQAEPGDYTATIRVGTVAGKTFPFTILPNHAPVLVSPLEDQVVNAASATVATLDIVSRFSDADGEKLQFEISREGDPVISTSFSDGKLTLTPDGYGLATVTVRALDARKAAATASFRVLARNAFQDMDIFPNPASDWLHVRPATDRTVPVELVNHAGAIVYSAPSVTIGPFAPLDIDLRELPGGTYSLLVGGQRFTVAKQ